MIVLWGPELIQIYNDSYRLLMGAKHPEGLGQANRVCWPEAWHINQSIYPRIFAGETIGFQEAKYALSPHGYLEDFYLTLSYSPIRDESGAIGGVFVTVFDVTSEVRTRHERDQALAHARAERQRLYDVFMQAPAAIAVVEGEDHVFTVANPRYRELVGNREVLGRPVLDALPEIREQGFVELLDNVRKTGRPFLAHDAQVQLDRGQPNALESVYLDFVYQPLEDTDGNVFGIMVHAVETTEQVRARHQLEALAAERRAILSQIADVVISLDADARISFMNDAAQVVYPGLELGRSFAEQSRTLTLLRLDGTPMAVHEMPTMRAVRGERVLGEEWIVSRPDGLQVRVQGNAVPLHDDAGAIRGAVLTVRDVTEQRRLQRQLEIERNRLVEVFQQAPAAIAITQGPEHTFLTANPVFRQLVSAHRAVEGLTIREAFPELDGQGFYELLDGVYASGEPFVGKELLARYDRDGDGKPEDAYLNFVYQPLTNEAGGVDGIMIHAVEVTDQVLARRDMERRAAQLVRLTQELEQSNRELDQFAYVASHDLKAPLRGIANLSAWIAEDLGDRLTEQSREHVRLLQGRVHRMEALIDGILAYSRAARVRTAPELVDTGALVREVVELLAPTGDVVVDAAPDMPFIDAERVPLQQVFMNLISNAVKYTRVERPDVRVHVGWRAGRESYEFFVRDNGPGIAPEYHERVWGIFQTLQARDKVEGTGIGLAVVKRIIESRGGSVWLESAPGGGSTFGFSWPRYTRPLIAQPGSITT
jgi:PAS domain S-box-containing protein